MADHWYNNLGVPCYGTGLRDARKLKYLPSVTSVDKMIANYGLEIWKQRQVLEASLTLTRGDNESDKDFIDRILTDSKEQGRKAAKLGNVIHKLAERYVSGKALFFHGQRKDVWTLFAPLRDWIDKNIQPVKSTISQEYGAEVVLVNEHHGYAGKADYFRNGMLLDYKTTGITAADIKKDGNIRKRKIYDSWGRQLAALRMAAIPDNIDKVLSVIISSNKDFPGVWIYEWSEEELDKAWIEFKAGLTLFKSIKKL